MIPRTNVNILPLSVCDCGYVIPELPHDTMFAQGQCPQCNAKITSWDDGYREIKVCKGWIRVGLWGESGGELNRKT